MVDEPKVTNLISRALPMVIPIIVSLAAVATAWGVLTSRVDRNTQDFVSSSGQVNVLVSNVAKLISETNRNTQDIAETKRLAEQIPTVASTLAALESEIFNIKTEQQYQRAQIDELRLKTKQRVDTLRDAAAVAGTELVE